MSNNLLFTVFNVISVVRVYWIRAQMCSRERFLSRVDYCVIDFFFRLCVKVEIFSRLLSFVL